MEPLPIIFWVLLTKRLHIAKKEQTNIVCSFLLWRLFMICYFSTHKNSVNIKGMVSTERAWEISTIPAATEVSLP